MDSRATPSLSLARELPYEILKEIFTHCVKQCVKDYVMQPDPKAAPMLLCQVCATWRAVTLTTPTLWAHLSFEMNIKWGEDGHPLVVYSAVERCMEWLGWWRRNLRSVSPYISVEDAQIEDLEINGQRMGRLPDHASDFFFKYLSSAQCLHVGRFYRYLVHQHFKEGSQDELHPNLHTLIVSEFWFDNVDSDSDLQFHHFISSIRSVHPTTKLRRFSNKLASRLRPHDYVDFRYNWSTLTHLSLSMMYIDLATWHTFIRTLQNLQLGFFTIDLGSIDNVVELFSRLETTTLPCLSLLRLVVFSTRGSTEESRYPLTALFKNLRLPALYNLVLQCSADTWYGTTAIAEVRAALLSAPSIRRLSLGEGFLGGQTDADEPPAIEVTPIGPDVEPLSTYAPRLETLEFCLYGPLKKHSGMMFAERIFGSGRWLDLMKPAGSIRKITLESVQDEDEDDDEDEDVDNAMTPAEKIDVGILINDIRRYVRPEVAVIHQDLEPAETRDTRHDWLDSWRWRYD